MPNLLRLQVFELNNCCLPNHDSTEILNSTHLNRRIDLTWERRHGIINPVNFYDPEFYGPVSFETNELTPDQHVFHGQAQTKNNHIGAFIYGIQFNSINPRMKYQPMAVGSLTLQQGNNIWKTIFRHICEKFQGVEFIKKCLRPCVEYPVLFFGFGITF